MIKIIFTFLTLLGLSLSAKDSRPNVIIVMADDQGYGDIKAHGHPFIRTPHMDKLHSESVRFTDFHVAPMCTPTRAQLMTGVDAMINGATAVCQGRSLIRRDVPTIANYFADAGYKTILSGKWHLGDSYPHRPQDRGFQEVLANRAWGIPSNASHWANQAMNRDTPSGKNAYYDPILEHNGVDKPFKGYVTDIFFDHAMQEVKKCKDDNKPFFLYLPTVTPHIPNISPDDKLGYYADYKAKNKIKMLNTNYYGMIENIDDNLKRLDSFLEENELKDNTIFIYTSDNGTQCGIAAKIYNAGMRGKKTHVYDGGHRVPLFIRYPNGSLNHGQDVNELTQVQDLCSTLLSLCNINPQNLYPQSGHDLTPLLKGEPWSYEDRVLYVQYRIFGEAWSFAVAMQGPWRMLKAGKQLALYNIAEDPHQDKNIYKANPEKAKFLEESYINWHKSAHKQFLKKRYFDLGHDAAPSTILYCNDWEGGYNDSNGQLVKSEAFGTWEVNVVQSGRYRIELARWPFESKKTLTEGVSLSKPALANKGAKPIAQASLEINGQKWESSAAQGATKVSFEVELTSGKQPLTTTFFDVNGKKLCSANYVRVTRL